MNDLPKRLDIKAGVMEMGEKISFGSDTALMREASEKIRTLENSLLAAKREAEGLAMNLWRKHYKDESPTFDLCDSVAGVISQIDNMSCCLIKQVDVQHKTNIERFNFEQHLEATMKAEIKEYLMVLANHKCWSDNEDFMVYDYAAGNIDDAYNGGVDDGEIMLARSLLDTFGNL